MRVIFVIFCSYFSSKSISPLNSILKRKYLPISYSHWAVIWEFPIYFNGYFKGIVVLTSLKKDVLDLFSSKTSPHALTDAI
jgi:hypothetical protein